MNSESQKLEELKKALFSEELEKQQVLASQLEEITRQLEQEKQKKKAKADPFVEEVVDRVAEVMPEKLGPSITETLRVQIRESRNEVVDALYPILGKLIRKYVQQEIQVLSERLDKQMESAFSPERWWEYIRVKWLGLSPGTLALRNLNEPEVSEIFVIEKDSGILIGSYSRHATVDQDLIAGMLTAIKSFLEDSFSTQKEEIETIEYESHKIQVRTFNRFYVAVVLKGIYTKEFQQKVDVLIDTFVEKTVPLMDQEPEEGSMSGTIKSLVETHDL